MSFFNTRPITAKVIVLTQAEIDAPTAAQLADYSVTYMLDEEPYTRFQSDGTRLLAQTPVVVLTQAQIDSPTAAILADSYTTYVLNVAPYTRYQSDGNTLNAVITQTVDPPTLVTALTSAQIEALRSGGTLEPYATYIASDTDFWFDAIDASTLAVRHNDHDCVMVNEPRFGGTFNGTAADDSAINAAATYAATFTPPKAIMLPHTVCIQTGCNIPSRVHVKGWEWSPGKNNTQVVPHASMSLTTGFMFNCNTTDGTTATVAPLLGQQQQCGLFGVWLNNNNVLKAGARLAVFAGTFIAQDIRGSRSVQLIKRISGEYIDNGSIKSVNCSQSYDNSEWQIDISGASGKGGEGLTITDLNFSVSSKTQALRVYGTSGCRISEVINGDIYIQNSASVELSNCHLELGQIFNDSSHIAIRSSFFEVANANSYIPIDCIVPGGTSQRYHMLLDDLEVRYGAIIFSGTNIAEVRTNFQYAITTRNCRRRIQVNSGQVTLQAIRICKQDNTEFTEWTKNMHYLSWNGQWNGNLPSGSYYATLVDDLTGLGVPVVMTGHGTSDLADETIYYAVQLIINPGTTPPIGVDYKGSGGAAERSVAVGASPTTKRVGMDVTLGSSSTQCVLRLYSGRASRGGGTGSYDSYADLPVNGGTYICDAGTYVNGVSWQSRTPGAVSAIIDSVGTWYVSPNAIFRAVPTTQAQSSSTTPAIDVGKGNYITFTCPAGNVTWGAPTNIPMNGELVTIKITQDSGGSRTQTWNAAFKGAWPTGAGTASQVKVITARSDGTNLIFQSDSGWY